VRGHQGVLGPRRWLPILTWLPAYDRAYLRRDVVAGAVVAALAVPQSLGYAAIAGVPVQVGLYAVPVALLAYAVVGTSPQLILGPVSTVSVLSATCGIRWGSLEKVATSAGRSDSGSLVNVRAGRHDCYDRLVLDMAGDGSARVRYVDEVRMDGSGQVVPLRGGAFLEILTGPAYDVQTGASTYRPANPNELVNVTGWGTFRQVADGGSFEGQMTIGLGVRARLPFRVFGLTGPGDGSRLVIDVAHRW